MTPNLCHISQIQCLPLFSLLLALDNPTVDYLSLDIEGAELRVLETIPWEKVKQVTRAYRLYLGTRPS